MSMVAGDTSPCHTLGCPCADYSVRLAIFEATKADLATHTGRQDHFLDAIGRPAWVSPLKDQARMELYMEGRKGTPGKDTV